MNAPASILKAATDAKTGGVIHLTYCTACCEENRDSKEIICYVASVRRSGAASRGAYPKPSLCERHYQERMTEQLGTSA